MYIYKYIYIYICTYTYIHIYIYMFSARTLAAHRPGSIIPFISNGALSNRGAAEQVDMLKGQLAT